MRSAGRPILFSVGLTAALAGLFGALSCAASPPAPPVESSPALRLLQAAAHTSVARTWSGTHRVVWLRGGFPRLTVVRVTHHPSTGTQSEAADAGTLAVRDVLNPTVLQVLERQFDLVINPGYDGKQAVVVEARRPGVTGTGSVAGRFWLDPTTGMVVRRDVLDIDGSMVRSTVLEDVALGEERAVTPALMMASGKPELDDLTLNAMTVRGWPIRRSLPAGMDLFQAQLHDGDGAEVLQLSYTDGLSTLSLFVQDGELASEPAGTARPVEDATVWVQRGAPERIVWSGDGHTWTLVSDAPQSAVRQALMSLPHKPRPVADGPGARLWRGMAVVGGWLNPFR